MTNSSTHSHPHPALLERSYVEESSRPDFLALGPLLGSGLCFGAAAYGHFFMEPPSEYRSFLILGGLVGLAYSGYRWMSQRMQVLVGDAGVAVERSGEQTRLLWWEIKSVSYKDSHLVLVGANTTLRISSAIHTRAIRAVLKEAAERLPSILDVPAKIVDELPKLKEAAEPPAERVQSLQIAGKRCAVSQQVITVERDARICPNCAAVYRHDKLPKVCAICGTELGKRAVAP